MQRFTLFLFFLFTITSATLAKDWSIEQVHITADVLIDGSVDITERRTYRFEGSFSHASYELNRSGFDLIRGINVSESNIHYERNDNKKPGTYYVTEKKNKITIYWFYEATDEERTFEINYLLDGPVVKGPEYAEFFWTFLGTGWDKGTKSLQVDLLFANHDEMGMPMAWLRSKNSDVNVNTYLNKVSVSGNNFHRRDGLAVRTVFPSEWIPLMEITDPDLSLRAVINEEKLREEQAAIDLENKAIKQVWGNWISYLLFILSPLILVLMYKRYGMRYQMAVKPPEELFEPPQNISPALAGWLITHSTITGSMLTATIFDLARRGYLKIIHKGEEKKRFTPAVQIFMIESTGKTPQESELLEFEMSVFVYLQNRIKKGLNRFDQILKHDSNSGYGWYNKWTKILNKDARSMGWHDEWSREGMVFASVIQGIFIAVAILAAIWSNVTGMIAAITTTLMFIFSFSIYKRSEKGEEAFILWKAYKKGLTTGNEKSLKSGYYAKHFIYALALGIRNKALDKLVPKLQGTADDYDWIVFLPGETFTSAILATHLSSLSASASASFGGSGASAGAAGGGGGGGAG